MRANIRIGRVSAKKVRDFESLVEERPAGYFDDLLERNAKTLDRFAVWTDGRHGCTERD